MVALRIINPNYEHSGFMYKILSDGLITYASPHPGQAEAARQTLYIRSAIESFLYDQASKSKQRASTDLLKSE